MLPPEREEELEIGLVNEAGRLRVGVGGRGEREGGGDGGPVGRKPVGLGAASRGDLGDVLRGGAGGAGAHNESHAVPEAADDGAAELLIPESISCHWDRRRRVWLSRLTSSATSEGVEEDAAEQPAAARARPRLRGSKRDPSARLRVNELMAERGGDGAVEERASNVLPAGLVEHSAFASPAEESRPRPRGGGEGRHGRASSRATGACPGRREAAAAWVLGPRRWLAAPGLVV
jgi:hypothetical protein